MQDAMMDELDKLEQLSALYSGPLASSSTTTVQPIGQSLDDLLLNLRAARHSLDNDEEYRDHIFSDVKKKIEMYKKRVDERQKQVHGSMTKFGKLIDKKFTSSLPSSPPLFSSPEAIAALERVIGAHFLRSGAFDIANVFYAECGIETPEVERANFEEMHRIIAAIRTGNLDPALDWAVSNREFLQSLHSTLEFDLHRSRYLRLLLDLSTPSFMDVVMEPSLHEASAATPAWTYSRHHFPSLYQTHPQCELELNRLTTILIYAGKPSILASTKAYSYLANSRLRSHEDLEKTFVEEWCRWMGVASRDPLQEVADLGGNGALARIEKGRKVMAVRKAGMRGQGPAASSTSSGDWWDAKEELMIELPVPPSNRYHSVFACPVSKEQATESNPPQMLDCGHVLAKDSVTKLTKGGGRVKCPYCPMESTGPPLQVHF